MKFLKNRGAAAAISIVLMVVSLFIGVHKSAQNASDKIEKLFYDGTNSAGSENTVSIYDQLTKRADAALGIVTIASNYDSVSEAAEEVRNARNSLLDAESISDMFVKNQSLERSTQQLVTLYRQLELDERDSDGLDKYCQRFDGAQTLIEQNTYNDKVTEFNKSVLNAFPLSVLKGIAGVEAPEKFS